MLAHDMGLGKTVQAIAIMQHYGSPVLVLCPAFLKCNWQQEILKWAPELDVHIQSYDSLRTNPPLRQGWKLVVADEAHYIKQKEAQRSRKKHREAKGSRQKQGEADLRYHIL